MSKVMLSDGLWCLIKMVYDVTMMIHDGKSWLIAQLDIIHDS